MPRLLTTEMLSTMEDCLLNDDELSARKLKVKLSEKFENFPKVPLSTIKKEIVKNVTGFVPDHIVVSYSEMPIR